jgi:hypothetical protein
MFPCQRPCPLLPEGACSGVQQRDMPLDRAATIGQGAGFLDLRPAIRSASARDILHGPRDFKHFNRKGMEVLGQTVAERMDQPLAQKSCANY